MRTHGEGGTEKSEYHVRFKDESKVGLSRYCDIQKEAWRSQLERAILRSSAVKNLFIAGKSTLQSFSASRGRSRAFSVCIG